MTRTHLASIGRTGAIVAALTFSLTGCVYDYVQSSDRIAYSTGDAVKANLERETLDPSKESMNDVTGLGQDGALVGEEPD